MTPAIVVADCLPRFHHPDGNLAVCVKDAPHPVPLPALSDASLIALPIVLVLAALAQRHRFGAGK